MKKVYYVDMDGVISNFHKEPYKYENAINRQWIANLEPFMYNVSQVRWLIMQGHTVYICTKAASNDAKLGKIDWLIKYIPEFKFSNFICIVGNGRKVDYMRTETGILIDDDIRNCRQWEKAGHECIWLETKGQHIDLR